MAARGASRTIDELALDPGVLEDGPVLELYGWRAVADRGGLAVLPWRGDWKRVAQARVEVVSHPDRLGEAVFGQAVVHLQKGRAATWHGLARAWRHVEAGGRLVLVGSNELGVKSAVKRLQGELGQDGEVVSNRARGRAVAFQRGHGPAPELPVLPAVEVEGLLGGVALETAPGVFSADRLDPGSRLLLDHLAALDPPHRLFDPGCGIGVLGLVALARWPEAHAVLADADRRAVEAARRNTAKLGLEDRCHVAWWDALGEPPPAEGCDLALCNPPFHTGKAIDLAPTRAVIRSLDTALAPGGVALVVTLRTLPLEADLRVAGRIEQLAARDGYKLIRLRR